MSFIRSAAVAAIGTTALIPLAPAAGAAPVAPRPAAKVWAAGTFTPGAALDVYGSCAKAGTTRATVAGPRAMRTTLTPMADRGHLGGEIAVPKALQGSWIRLTMRCADGSSATVVVRRGATTPTPTPRPTPKPPPRPTPRPAPKAALKVWTTGALTPGAKIQVFAANALDRKGKAATTATVAGPRAMRATLRPVGGETYLGGSVTVPRTLSASWIRLTVTAPDGRQAKVVVRR